MAGLSKGMSIQDIAKKHNISVDVLKQQLKKGIKVEHEHTGNVKQAARIAMDHLFEDPKYYTKLAKIKLEENQSSINSDLVKEFIKHVKNELKLDKLPKIKLSNDSQEAINMRSWGGYQPANKSIHIIISKRHPADIFRTLAHELVHYKQDIEGRLKMGSGSTGSEHENEANSKAAVIMRNFAQAKPNLFEHLINEIGEITNPYKWYLDYIDDEGSYYFKFSTPQNEYSVVATQEPSEYDVYNLTFSVGGSYSVETNEGVVLRVLSTIADIALDVLKKTEASKILIYPTKDKDEKSSRRFNIYKPFIMKNIPYPYELEISDGTYIITKNDSYARRNNP